MHKKIIISFFIFGLLSIIPLTNASGQNIEEFARTGNYNFENASGQNVEELKQIANHHFENTFEFDLAISFYDQILEIEPDNIEIIIDKGLSQAFLFRHNESLKTFEKIL